MKERKRMTKYEMVGSTIIANVKKVKMQSVATPCVLVNNNNFFNPKIIKL